MNGNCRTISPLQEIASCLLNGECGSRHSNGCTAASMLITRMQKELTDCQQPYFCTMKNHEISCDVCLRSIITGSCQKPASCQSPFWKALKEVAERGEVVFEKREVISPIPFIIHSHGKTTVCEQKILVPVEDRSRKKETPPSPLKPAKVLPAPTSSPDIIAQPAALPKREIVSSTSPVVLLKPKADDPSLKTLFGSSVVKKLASHNIFTLSDICRCRVPELETRLGKPSAQRIYNRIRQRSIDFNTAL